MQVLLSLSNDADHQRALEETGFWGQRGAGLILMCSNTGRFLLPLRSVNVEQPGTWGTWGGAIDRKEDPREAAAREIYEEAGIKVNPSALQKLFTFTKGTFKYTTYLSVTDKELRPRLDKETSTAEWFHLHSFPRPLHFGLDAVLSDPKARTLIDLALKSVTDNQLAALAREVEAYQSNHYGYYDKQKLVDAFKSVEEDVRDRFFRAPRSLMRGSDHYYNTSNFEEYCAGQTATALSFTANAGVAQLFGPVRTYHEICSAIEDSLDVTKFVKELRRRRIPNEVNSDEGEVILMGVQYRKSMK